MNPTRPDDPRADRRLELLIDQTLHGLEPAEAAELARLPAPAGPADDLTIELAAAAVALSQLDLTSAADLPADLAARIDRAVSQPLESRPKPVRAIPAGRREVVAGLGWLVAAALIAWIVLDPGRTGPTVALWVATDPFRENPSVRLVASDHPLARGSGGTLAWDEGRGQGALRVEGLAAVDPREGCYQLWIFDGSRDDRYPVDGGIFTVARGATGSGQVVAVTVRPRVSVRVPTAFAITLEPPGGVVVSDRERVFLSANWPPGPAPRPTP